MLSNRNSPSNSVLISQLHHTKGDMGPSLEDPESSYLLDTTISFEDSSTASDASFSGDAESKDGYEARVEFFPGHGWATLADGLSHEEMQRLLDTLPSNSRRRAAHLYGSLYLDPVEYSEEHRWRVYIPPGWNLPEVEARMSWLKETVSQLSKSQYNWAGYWTELCAWYVNDGVEVDEDGREV